MVKHVKWPPGVINELTFAQIAALSGAGRSGKIEVKSFEELRPHLDAYLEREKPENALREAEAALSAWLARGGR